MKRKRGGKYMDKSKTYWLLKTIIAMSYDFKIYGGINVQENSIKDRRGHKCI